MLSYQVLKERYKELKKNYDNVVCGCDVKTISRLKKQNEKLKEENKELYLKYLSQKKKLAEIRTVILRGE